MRHFDPFGLLEKWLDARTLHRLIRLGAIAILIVFLVHRIGQYPRYLAKTLWVLETFTYILFILSYFIRIDPVERSVGFKEIVPPLIGAILPFALLFTPPNAQIVPNRTTLYGIYYFMIAATALIVWGLWVLRGSFSITVEARALVTRGPYRWIRHPVYLGEMLSAGAVMLWRYSPRNLCIFAAFAAIQLLRSRWEERKLGRVFPLYSAYAARTFWFLKANAGRP